MTAKAIWTLALLTYPDWFAVNVIVFSLLGAAVWR